LPSAQISPTWAAKAELFSKLSTLRFNPGEWLTSEELREVHQAAWINRLTAQCSPGVTPAMVIPVPSKKNVLQFKPHGKHSQTREASGCIGQGAEHVK
jgi:hypothetical protein